MVEDFGVVLKSFLPYKNKIAVLAQREGRTNLIVAPGRLHRKFSAGVAIRFFASPRDSRFISNVEVVIVPVMPLGPHLYWFHHILEICYYFIPVGYVYADMFRLVRYALDLSSKSHYFEPYFHIVRKVFLLKTLILLGFYPKQALVDVANLFKNIVLVILDSSNVQKVRSLHVSLSKIDNKTLKEIDIWVLACLYEHPHVKYFKTLSFFDDM